MQRPFLRFIIHLAFLLFFGGLSALANPGVSAHFATEAVRAKLENLAHSTDIGAARDAYLSTVFAHAWADGALSESFLGTGDPAWLEAATRIAEGAEDRARAFILWADYLDRNGTSFAQIQEAGRAWEEAVAVGRETALLPHALLGRARWQRQHGRVHYDESGIPQSAPDPASAVATLDELMQRFSIDDSPRMQEAVALRTEIFTEELSIEAPYSFRPEADVRVEIHWRNLANLRIRLWAVDLTGGDAEGTGNRAAWTESLPRLTEEPVVDLPVEPAAPSFTARRQVIRLGENLPAGAYRVEVSAEGDKRRVADLLLIGEAALVLHATPSSVVAQAVHVQTGHPLAGTPVAMAHAGDWITHETDGLGLVTFKIEEETAPDTSLRAILTSPEGPATAVISRPRPAPLVEFERVYFATAARTHYRRGETVHFRIIGRQLESNRLWPLNPDTAPLPHRFAVVDNRGENVAEGDLTWTPFGTASGEAALGTRVVTGQYFLALLGPGDEEIRYEPLFFVHAEEPPVFHLSATLVGENTAHVVPIIAPGTPIDGRVRLTYFGGTEPGAAQPIELRVFSRSLSRPLAEDWRHGASTLRETISLITDSRGEATFRVTSPADSAEDLELDLHFSISGVSPREEALRRAVWVTSHPRQITLRSNRRIVQPGEAIRLLAHSADLHGEAAPARGRLRVTRDRWRQIYVHTRRGTEITGEAYRQLPERSLLGTARSDFRLRTEGFVTETVLERPFPIDSSGQADIRIPDLTQGYYRAAWVSSDGRVGGPETETEFWVVPAGDSTLGYRPGGIRLIVEEGPHEMGDSVSVLITTDQPGAHVLFQRGDDHLRDAQLLELTGNARHFLWSVGENDAPNTHLFVSTLFEGNLYRDHAMVPVSAAQRPLHLQVTLNAPDHEPGDPASAVILVQDADGQPVKAELAVSLSGGSSPERIPPLMEALQQAFQADLRPWRTRLSTSFRNRPFFRPEMPAAEKSSVTPDRLVSTGDSLFGGIQNALELSRQGPLILTNGTRTPLNEGNGWAHAGSDLLWHGHLETDTDGRAAIDWTFPRELGKWTLEILAVTPENNFGHHRSSVETKQPLVLRSRQPAFLHVGDVATISVLVTNSLDYSQTFQVRLESLDGKIRIEEPPPSTIQIGPQESRRISTRMHAPEAGNATLRWSAVAGSARDEVTSSLEIHPLHPPPPRWLRARITGPSFEVDLGNTSPNPVNLVILPGVAPFLLDALETLLPPDLHTLDQIAVRGLLPLLTRENLLSLGYEVSPEASEFLDVTETALTLLRESRSSQAGWPWMPALPANAETTALILSLLHQRDLPAAKMPLTAMNEARTWLTARLDHPEIPPDTRAHVLYSLAARHRSDPGSPGPAEARAYLELMRERSHLPDHTIARLARTAHSFGFEEDARLLLGILRERARTGPGRVPGFVVKTPAPAPRVFWGGGNTPHRQTEPLLATAAALSAWLTLDPRDPLVPPAMEGLLALLGTAANPSSAARAATLVALNDYLRFGGELDHDHTYTVTTNGRRIAREQVSILDDLNRGHPLSVLPDAPVNQLSVQRERPEGPLYVRLHQGTNRLPAALPPSLQIERRLYRIREVPTLLRGFREERTLHEPGTPLFTTDRVEMVIQLVTPEPLNRIIITDPRPAGFEPPRSPPHEGIRLHSLTAPVSASPPQAHPRIRPRETLFHIEHLPAGTWELRYRMRLDTSGDFQHPLLDETLRID